MVHYHGQILALTECGYRHTYNSQYLLTQDLDEFVVPTVAQDWSSMLDNFRSSSVQRDHIASYSFRNRFFPLQFPDDIDQVFQAHRQPQFVGAREYWGQKNNFSGRAAAYVTTLI